jgi:hypothetical protein
MGCHPMIPWNVSMEQIWRKCNKENRNKARLLRERTICIRNTKNILLTKCTRNACGRCKFAARLLSHEFLINLTFADVQSMRLLKHVRVTSFLIANINVVIQISFLLHVCIGYVFLWVARTIRFFSEMMFHIFLMSNNHRHYKMQWLSPILFSYVLND